MMEEQEQSSIDEQDEVAKQANGLAKLLKQYKEVIRDADPSARNRAMISVAQDLHLYMHRDGPGFSMEQINSVKKVFMHAVSKDGINGIRIPAHYKGASGDRLINFLKQYIDDLHRHPPMPSPDDAVVVFAKPSASSSKAELVVDTEKEEQNNQIQELIKEYSDAAENQDIGQRNRQLISIPEKLWYCIQRYGNEKISAEHISNIKDIFSHAISKHGINNKVPSGLRSDYAKRAISIISERLDELNQKTWWLDLTSKDFSNFPASTIPELFGQCTGDTETEEDS